VASSHSWQAAPKASQLGALNAEGYAECCKSVGKQVFSEGNTLLSDEEIEMLMVLHMNKQGFHDSHARELLGNCPRDLWLHYYPKC
jgi:hypothetical protein